MRQVFVDLYGGHGAVVQVGFLHDLLVTVVARVVNLRIVTVVNVAQLLLYPRGNLRANKIIFISTEIESVLTYNALRIRLQ